eukprot:g19329.t1
MKAFFLSTTSFVTLASGASQRAFLGKTEDKVEQHLAIVNPEGDAKSGDEEYASWLETGTSRTPKLHANIAGQTQVLQRARAQIKEQESALQKQADDARKAASYKEPRMLTARLKIHPKYAPEYGAAPSERL